MIHFKGNCAAFSEPSGSVRWPPWDPKDHKRGMKNTFQVNFKEQGMIFKCYRLKVCFLGNSL